MAGVGDSNTDTTDSSSNDEELLPLREISITDTNEYNKTLSLTKMYILHIMLSGVSYVFLGTYRLSIWLLYAETFMTINYDVVAWAFFFYYIFNGFITFFCSALANYYGYDHVLCVLVIIQSIGVLLEATSQEYIQLSIGLILSGVGIFPITFGAIAWLLPIKLAIKYTSYSYAVAAIFILLGPIFAGIFSFYISYRTAFYINFAFSFMIVLHSLMFIRNKQTFIQNEQLKYKKNNMKNNDNVFPICNCLEDDNYQQTSKWYSIPQNMSNYEWIMLLIVVFNNAAVGTSEGTFVAYFMYYIVNILNNTVVIASFIQTVGALFFMITAILISKWINSNINTKSIFKNPYLIIILSGFVSLIVFSILFPTSSNENKLITMYMYWFYVSLWGISTGCLLMSTEIMLLTNQPTKHSGKIAGIKALFKNVLNALILLIIGFLWESTPNILYFSNCAVIGIILLLTIFMIILHKKHGSLSSIKFKQ